MTASALPTTPAVETESPSAVPPAPPVASEPVLLCPHCDYNLAGLPEDRCPECGELFNRQQLTE